MNLPEMLTTMMYLSTTTDDGSTLQGILAAATQIVTWVITSMGSFLKFVTDNPVVLILFLLTIVGFAVGMLMRLWKSV